MKRLMVIGVILLIFSITLVPTIDFNAVRAASENEFVNVTLEICGVKEYKNTTVKLTKQQYQALEGYLANFRSKLNQTKTREDAVPLYKEVVIELNKFGLLPKSMSVKQAQKLVTGEDFFSVYDKLVRNSNNVSINPCLVTGQATNTDFYGPLLRFLAWFPLVSNAGIIGDIIIFIIASIFFTKLISSLFLYYFMSLIPVALVSLITFGYYVTGDHINEEYPSSGWVKAFTPQGLREWNGTFIGKLGSLNNPLCKFNIMWWSYTAHIGVRGFCGFKLNDFFIGSALNVELG
jgi:hypothetical protein